MPAASQAQQKAAGAALAVKRGEADEKGLFGASLEMYSSMTEEELSALATGHHDDLPERQGED